MQKGYHDTELPSNEVIRQRLNQMGSAYPIHGPIVALAQREQIPIQLAYYPPYHSKYNPVERIFGWLEQHWWGSLLDSVETVVQFAKSLTFKGTQPTVNLVTQTYNTGVKLTQKAMAELEKALYRLPGLEKWFVEIVPTSA